MRKKGILILAFLFLVCVSAFLMLKNRERITGLVVYKGAPISNDARGGMITQLNISYNIFSYWKGYYGNLTQNDIVSFPVGEQVIEIKEQNIGLYKCYSTELYATPSTYHLALSSSPILPPASYLNSLQAEANPTHFEEYFNLSNLPELFNVIKMSRIANITHTFEVGDYNLTAYSTRLNSMQ